MNTGFICEWNFNDRVGRIVGCSGERDVYPFEWDQCTDPLKVHLAQNRIIHLSGPCPGPTDAIQVKFDVLGGEARSVDLARAEA